MATTHANTPTDTLRRLESLCLMAGIEMPMVAVRAQVASAINGVICCERFHDGSRRTTAISEVLPLDEKGDYRTQSLFVYVPTHKDGAGKLHGYHSPTGIIPTFLGRMQAHGFPEIDEKFFDPATYGMPPPPTIFSEKVSTRWVPALKHRERGEADSPELKDLMARAKEFSEKQEKDHKDRIKAGTVLEGYKFDEDAHKAAAPAPAAAAPAAKPAEAARPAEPAKPATAAAKPAEAARPALPAAKAEELPPPEIDSRPTASRPPFNANEKTGIFSENTRPPQQRPPARPGTGTGPRPAAAQRRDDPKIQVSDELGTEEQPDEPPPPPPARSGLPPGKRPLPPGKRPLPVRTQEPAEGEEEEAAPAEEEPADLSGETHIREMPNRFRR
jgi:pilus assembly protein CpaF